MLNLTAAFPVLPGSQGSSLFTSSFFVLRSVIEWLVAAVRGAVSFLSLSSVSSPSLSCSTLFMCLFHGKNTFSPVSRSLRCDVSTHIQDELNCNGKARTAWGDAVVVVVEVPHTHTHAHAYWKMAICRNTKVRVRVIGVYSCLIFLLLLSRLFSPLVSFV